MSTGVFREILETTSILAKNRRILVATTRVELAKRYSGSILGMLWVPLFPVLFLSVYLFVYLVIFKMKFPGYSQLDYVVYVFCGLVPYIGFMESVNSGCHAIKQNIHLVKNVMLPIELVPVRYVLSSMVAQLVGMGVLLLLVALNGSLSLHLTWLPILMILQIAFLVGLVWILAGLAVVVPDISYFVNLMTLLLVFISPIGFKPDMVPSGLSFMVDMNPIYYMLEVFRYSLFYGGFPPLHIGLPYVLMCLVSFGLGAVFFRRFRNILVDYE
ncbi:MAG: ABC transporter permease [Gammaproteobacteria bacterium]|nr:ABC transporter permease [Gammaproteobacteria bacterium]MCP5135996.1 ABC transporter permease [Gammaproteobacteria bacterium]